MYTPKAQEWLLGRILELISLFTISTYNLFAQPPIIFKYEFCSGIPEAETFGQNRKFSAFGFRFRPPKVKAEYGRNSRKALDFLLFVHENIANVNYQC